MNEGPDRELRLGPHADAVASRLDAWARAGFVERLRRRDPTLWAGQALPELADRLGWVDLPGRMGGEVAALAELAAEVTAEGLERVLVLGMGGSGLAPEVFAQALGEPAGRPRLSVLDSTHPRAVAESLRLHPPETTLYVVSSKSGTTIETLSFCSTFWAEAQRLAAPGSRFVAITDPGTPLAALAAERSFRRTFLADPEVGGRFSALSHFGLVPAALAGVDVERLLAGAEAAAADLESALALGAALAELALGGRDKLTLETDLALRSFPAWLEQLVAESLGKQGRGVVPIEGEPALPPSAYGPDRFFVRFDTGPGDAEARVRLQALAAAGHPTARLRLADAYELGGEMLRWEVATAAAGAALGVNPFDQPDVESAKQLARQAMAGGGGGADVPTLAADDLEAVDLDAVLGLARPGDYLAILAYLPPTPGSRARVGRLRERLLASGCATTVGFGPRYLHSTGQLHKGGPDTGLFVQLEDRPTPDLAIPGAGTTYGRLIGAQALGDARALVARGRRLLRLELEP
jgi:transaldolase/glucose-6-phosphate isomerase